DSIPRNRSLSRSKPSPESVPTRKHIDALDLAVLGISETPLHLAVGSTQSRGCSQLVRCHVWQGPSSAKSFALIADDLYASSAEACFLQLATALAPVELAQVGMEFCGSYALDAQDPNGFRPQLPLTSARALERYLQKAEGIRGVKQARQALRFIADNSASPMETIVTLLLCLPNIYGGYGLELPKLNQTIKMPDEVRATTGRKQCICDLFWPKAKLAVEYDSDQWHADTQQISSDSKRRTALELAGVTVVTITRGQVYDARAFDETARALAKRLGKRIRVQCDGWFAKRFALRTQLLQGVRSSADI
ncbi:MAG: hypothetical protein RR619_06365, partial [Raoultibacter sp.]